MDITLTDVLNGTLKRHYDRTAIQIGEEKWRYADLDNLSNRLAGSLEREGISKGDRIALYLKNCVEYVIADLAILKLGAVKVPLNEFQSANDVAYILDDTQASTLIAHRELLDGVADTIRANRAVTLTICVDYEEYTPTGAARSWESFFAESEFSHPVIRPEDLAIITYTGGTTGKPKGVVQTQASLAINLLSHVISSELSPDEVMLLMTPLPHSAGYHLQSCLLQGGTVILADGFSSDVFYNHVSQHHVTWTFMVPTMISRLLDDPHPYNKDRSSLRTIVYGAAPMSADRLKTAIERFGLCFIQLYGQTESPNYITALTKEDHAHEQLHRSCGKAVALAKIKTTAEDGKSTGEVVVKTPYLLKEYYKNKDATSDALRSGWLYTGDIGYIDEDGYLFLQDRTKDMIISGGMNVYSIEVEQELKSHPSVIDAAVIGLPHPDWGEQVHAVVVSEHPVEIEALIAHCRVGLSKYKVPKSIQFTDSLPLTAYGKIDKKAIKKQNLKTELGNNVRETLLQDRGYKSTD